MKREAWPPEWEQDPPKCGECGEQHWPGEKHATAAHDKAHSVDPDAEHEVRADEVRPGDYLLGLGRVQSCNDSGGPAPRRRVTLFSEGGDWTVNLNPRARVVVIHAR